MYRFKSGHVIPIRANINSNKSTSVIENLKQAVAEEDIVADNISLDDKLLLNTTLDVITPLNTIHSAVQLIELFLETDESISSEKIAININLIKQNSYRLIKTINNTLDLHKINLGLLKLNYKYANIVEVVEVVVQRVSDILNSKHLNLIFDTDAEEAYMMFDAVILARALLILLYYAAKFSNPNGVIKVETKISSSSISIEISFNGNSGIEYIESLFSTKKEDKFSLLKSETSGSDIKLSEMLVELHGGYIKFVGNSTNSSTFIIVLPRKINESIFSPFRLKTINADRLDEMVNIEFSDIDF